MQTSDNAAEAKMCMEEVAACFFTKTFKDIMFILNVKDHIQETPQYYNDWKAANVHPARGTILYLLTFSEICNIDLTETTRCQWVIDNYIKYLDDIRLAEHSQQVMVGSSDNYTQGIVYPIETLNVILPHKLLNKAVVLGPNEFDARVLVIADDNLKCWINGEVTNGQFVVLNKIISSRTNNPHSLNCSIYSDDFEDNVHLVDKPWEILTNALFAAHMYRNKLKVVFPDVGTFEYGTVTINLGD